MAIAIFNNGTIIERIIMRVAEFTSLENLAKRNRIQVQIPKDRRILIPKEISGWKHDQEFTRNDWPAQVNAKLIGLAEDKQSGGHPVYVVDASIKMLRLGGQDGLDFGPGILDRICRTMFVQPGVIAAFSLRLSMLERFDYEHEEYNNWVPSQYVYWVASQVPEVFDRSCEYNLCRVRDGRLHLRRLYNSEEFSRNREGTVRAVIVLQTKVPSTKGRSDIKWVEI